MESKDIIVDKELVERLVNYEVTIDGKKEKPIVVMAPDGTDETSLRLYAFGGNIGRIPYFKNGEYQTADKAYAKYIRFPNYTINYNKVSHKYDFPDWLKDYPIEEKKSEELLKEYSEKRGSIEELKKCFDTDSDSLYLPLILGAAGNRFTCKKKGYVGKKMERWKQHEIAKYYMEHTSKGGSIITDLEFEIPISAARMEEKAFRSKNKDKEKKEKTQKQKGASKPDFVIFDGERFGIVEFKYLGQSMETHSANSLDWHLLDFYDAVGNEAHNHIDLYNKCLDRLECLLECGVILPSDKKKQTEVRDSLEKCRENARSDKDIKDLFWFGFLFVGGNKTSINKLIKSQLIESKLPKNCVGKTLIVEKKAIETVKEIIEKEKIELYGLYCEDSDDIRDISIDMKNSTFIEMYEGLYEV